MYFCKPPMYALNSSLGSPCASEKMLLPSASTTLWWICSALPASSDIGRARNVACISCAIAASLTVRLNRKTWSARSIASPCRKFSSNCAGPISWDSVSIRMSCTSQYAYTSFMNGSKSFIESMLYGCFDVSVQPSLPSGGSTSSFASECGLIR